MEGYLTQREWNGMEWNGIEWNGMEGKGRVNCCMKKKANLIKKKYWRLMKILS